MRDGKRPSELWLDGYSRMPRLSSSAGATTARGLDGGERNTLLISSTVGDLGRAFIKEMMGSVRYANLPLDRLAALLDCSASRHDKHHKVAFTQDSLKLPREGERGLLLISSAMVCLRSSSTKISGTMNCCATSPATSLSPSQITGMRQGSRRHTKPGTLSPFP
jgi:hypothetical protein